MDDLGDRLARLQRALAESRLGENRAAQAARAWRWATFGLGLMVTTALAVGVVAALVVTRGQMPEPPAPEFVTEGGMILCGPWQATGETCPGGCRYQRKCYECDDNGNNCDFAYYVTTCLPSSGAYCPLIVPPDGYLLDERDGELYRIDTGELVTPDR